MIGARWGVTDDEVARPYPCDDLVPDPALQLWRGVTVAVSSERLWPWVAQIQLAPYSYDWVDNLGRRSPRSLRGLPDPQPGEAFTSIGDRVRVGRVLSVVPGEHLTATIMGAVLSYVVVPQGSSTRLLMKVVLEHRRWYGSLLALGDWPMARRQLLNLKALAESSPPGPGQT
ncbi:MAG TPA: polyketide cyclase [Mycobacteriales bacterium]|nr:polyketide cyclase [Mycobacteriales bacterium]